MKNFTKLFLCLLLIGVQVSVFAADATVNVSDFQYSPQAVTINAGDKVTWNWVSGSHPTVSDSNPAAWATFPMDASNPTFSHTFTTPGVYPYHCQVHGLAMSGVVNVVAAPAGIKKNKTQEEVLYLYPNPAHGFVNIKFETKGSAEYKVRITNVLGETVDVISAARLRAGSGETISFQMNDFPAGFYFFSLFMNNKIIDTRRLVLEK